MLRLALLSTLVACTTTSPPAEGALQMNDLSIMFPLPASNAELAASLQASTLGVGGALVPKALFDADSDATSIDYAQLRAVAFRLDPCFAHTGPLDNRSDCAAQLRVVFQNVSDLGNGDIEAQDSGVHAFYSLTNDQFDAAVHDVVAARLANGGTTDLGALAVHPILVQQGLSGAFGTALRSIVTRYAGAGNLVKLTSFLGLGFVADAPSHLIPSTDFWSFEGFDIAAATPTAIVIPTLDNQTTMSITSDSFTQFAAGMSPVTSSADNISALLSVSGLDQTSTKTKQDAFDSALRVLNPAMHSPNTIDCASCHLAQFAVQLVGEPVVGLTTAGNANAFTADASIPTEDLAVMKALIQGDQSINLHAFSYRGTGPMINQRVVNETALNVAFLTAQGL